jgi:hypothetical protein
VPLNNSGVPSRAQIQAAIDEGDAAIEALLAFLPVRVAAGSTTVTLTASGADFTAVTFPASRFTVAPLVFATVSSGAAGTSKFVPRVLAVTTTGANVYVYTGDATSATGSVSVSWLAVQMTATTAAG